MKWIVALLCISIIIGWVVLLIMKPLVFLIIFVIILGFLGYSLYNLKTIDELKREGIE